MKTDRELLELAAKAAGYKEWDNEWWSMCDGDNHWDPLRHNGQALRLAVKLCMQLDIINTQVRCLSNGGPTVYELDLAEPSCAATRRAIVRAAAAIGESL